LSGRPATSPRDTDAPHAETEHEDTELRESSRQALRGFVDRVVIPPGEGLLQVVRNLGEMLTAAGGGSGKALFRKLVAGARNRLDLAGWWTAA